MKKLLTVFVGLGVLFSSCDFVQGYIKGASANAEDSLAAKDDFMAVRDMSITAANAYSDLFLDSAAVESYIQSQKIKDTLARKMRSFYNGRNYQAAWLSSSGFTEQGRSFWSSADSATRQKDNAALTKENKNRIDSLMEVDSVQLVAADSLFLQTELALTQQFLRSNANWVGGVQQVHRFFIPAKKTDALQLADSLLNKSEDGSFGQQNKMYAALKNELQRYYTLAKDSSWQPISVNAGQLKKGISAPAVALIKKRLAATGDWASADTSHLYSDSLQAAIASFQKRHGLDSTGALTDTMLSIMNVHPKQRLEQILINMNRTLWTPAEENGNRAVVNIPAFMLQVYEGSQLAFEMPVVVGKEGTNTLLLNGRLNEVVFNPYWNIPASIVQSEIMPAMQKDANYLKKNNMEVVNKGDSLPQVRQLPGSSNALGKVKFLFPNSFDIYLHDSPAKHLFNEDKRAFSHGCIRLADATKMAQYLLRQQSGWTPEKVAQAMNSGKEQRIPLQQALPISINYYTAWVDDKGKVHFRDDVYGHDAKMRSMWFSNSGV